MFQEVTNKGTETKAIKCCPLITSDEGNIRTAIHDDQDQTNLEV